MRSLMPRRIAAVGRVGWLSEGERSRYRRRWLGILDGFGRPRGGSERFYDHDGG